MSSLQEKLIFEKPQNLPSRYFKVFNYKEISQMLPENLLRKELPLPQVGEREVIRHYLNLARLNFSLDGNFYPLGSCTMKYNPKINEEIAAWENFTDIHPLQPEETIQGSLEVMFNLAELLKKITGMAEFSLSPGSGAQAEFCGLLIIKKYQEFCKQKKYKIIIPDSAHGTNPASVKMAGFCALNVESTKDGLVDMDKFYKAVDSEVAGCMLTNPNTLGLFEKDIEKISDILHKKGALLYYDGANFNSLLGITTPSLMGFDIVHLNLHKTFATPHGSGGPGAGALGVKSFLREFLPVPVVGKKRDKFFWDWSLKHSIGRIRNFYGNFPVLLKAYCYLLSLGKEGIFRVGKNAVLSANYIKEKLKDNYQPASALRCMHEVVFSLKKQKMQGVSVLDVAKRLLDYKIHPPTVYFPLIVKEALMVEPTETESKEVLDYFIEAMKSIAEEIEQDPDKVKSSPHNLPVKRVDEVGAARNLDVRYYWKNKENKINSNELAKCRGD